MTVKVETEVAEGEEEVCISLRFFLNIWHIARVNDFVVMP